MKKCIRFFTLALAFMLVLCTFAPTQAAVTAPKQSTKAFTVDDITYFKGFALKKDKAYKKGFNLPDYAAVKAAFGKPTSADEDEFTRVYDYAFGEVELSYAKTDPNKRADELCSFTMSIINKKLTGPRGINIGDSYETVLLSYKNTQSKKKLPTNKAEVVLYTSGNNPYYYGCARFEKSALYELEYQQESNFAVARVTYVISKGLVKEIQCNIFWV